MNALKSFIGFVGRALLSLFFIAGGLHALLHWAESEQVFISKLHDWVTTYLGHPGLQDQIEWMLAHSTTVFLFATFLQLIGGMMLFLGLGLRLGVVLLLIYLVPLTFFDHYYWLLKPAERGTQLMPFLESTALIGGLLFILARGKGRKKSAPSSPSSAPQ